MANAHSMPGGAPPVTPLSGEGDTGSESLQSTATAVKDGAPQPRDAEPELAIPSQPTTAVTKDGAQQSRNVESGPVTARPPSSGDRALSDPSPSIVNTAIQTGSSVSLTFQGLRVNFDVEFAQLAWNTYTFLRHFFVSRWSAPPPEEPMEPTEPVSHIPRRAVFMLLCLAIVTACVNWSYSSSPLPCVWKANTDALAELQMSRIGALLNSTAHGTARITELTSARLGISELRIYVEDRYPESAVAAALDTTLKHYGDDMSFVVQKLIRVDASITALVHVTIAHNVAAYEQLDLAGYTPWWLVPFCWSACQGPSFEAVYPTMLNLEESVLRALETTLYDSNSLKDGVQRLYNHSSQIQHHVNALSTVRATSSSDGQPDALALLWDSVAPYRTPVVMKANRRLSLIAARTSQRRSMDYAIAIHENIVNVVEQMRLLKLGLKGVDDPWFWQSKPEIDKDICSPSSERGVKAFKALLLAVHDLRTLLAHRI